MRSHRRRKNRDLGVRKVGAFITNAEDDERLDVAVTEVLVQLLAFVVGRLPGYVVGRYCGPDTSGSAFYLAAWTTDDSSVVRERLGRISRTAQEIIKCLSESDSSRD